MDFGYGTLFGCLANATPTGDPASCNGHAGTLDELGRMPFSCVVILQKPYQQGIQRTETVADLNTCKVQRPIAL